MSGYFKDIKDGLWTALVGMGITDLSMSATSIPQVKQLIRSISAADCRTLVQELLTMTTYDAVAQRVAEWSAAHIPDRLVAT